MLTCSDRYSHKVVDESKDKIDPYPMHRFLRQLDARHHVQQVVLQSAKRFRSDSLNAARCFFTDYQPPTRIRTMSAASIATSVPVPMAMPTSARARAGESLMPSPTMATSRPRSCSSWTLATLCDGSTSANTFLIPTCSRTNTLNTCYTLRWILSGCECYLCCYGFGCAPVVSCYHDHLDAHGVKRMHR